MRRHEGPILIVAEAAFGGAYLVDALRRGERSMAWLELARYEAADVVNVGNKLSASLTRALGSDLIPKALPYPAVLTSLARDLPMLGPLRLAVSGAEHLPDLAKLLLAYHGAQLGVLLDAERRPPGLQLPPTLLVLRESDLTLTPADALDLSAGRLPDAEVRNLLNSAGGAYEPFVVALHERLGMPTPLRPGPEGPRFVPGTEPEVDPAALLDLLLERRRPLAALELAAGQFPERVDAILASIGPELHALGLHGRMWELLESLPPGSRRCETTLFWRLSSAFRIGRLEGVTPDVEAYLDRHEAPDLRALYAGTTLTPARALPEVERAYRAAQTPLTAYHMGRLAPPAEGVRILRESVRIAEVSAPAYTVVRNAGALVSRLLHLGRYGEAITWGRWALAEFDKAKLGDGQRRARIINDWAYARILAGETAGLDELLTEQEAVWADVHPVLARTYRTTLADLHLALGRPEEAHRHYRLVYDSVDRRRLGRAAIGLVRALVELGEGVEARRVAEEAVDLTLGEEALFRAPALLARVVALARSDPRRALDFAQEARRTYARTPSADRQAQLVLHEAAAELALGRPKASSAAIVGARVLLSAFSMNGLRMLSGPATAFREIWSHLVREAPALDIRFLGRREVWLHDAPVPVSNRLAELLTLLALSRQPMSLESLQARLYGDGRNRQALKVAVARLRKQVPVSPHPYQLTVPFQADFLELEKRLEQGRLHDAIELYDGPLLKDSDSSAIREHNAYLTEALRRATLSQGDPEALLRLHELFPEDLEILEAVDNSVDRSDPRAPLIKARAARVRADYLS